ncbi:MAG: hypothetical protein J0I29_02285 [Rhizobiales bacterium]|nr:hypothetical protein [Hyphomicrobiales bacterium]
MFRSLTRIVPVLLAAALLSACAQFERSPPRTVVDDDAYCRSQGFTQGSKEYAACLKDRDVAVSRENRMERAHKNLAEDMLNGR